MHAAASIVHATLKKTKSIQSALHSVAILPAYLTVAIIATDSLRALCSLLFPRLASRVRSVHLFAQIIEPAVLIIEPLRICFSVVKRPKNYGDFFAYFLKKR
jgi:hypothetical protein